jgi:hypothetical protein
MVMSQGMWCTHEMWDMDGGEKDEKEGAKDEKEKEDAKERAINLKDPSEGPRKACRHEGEERARGCQVL